MAIALVASALKASSNGGTFTTDALDTTGANLIVLSVSWYGGTAPTISDSNSNTWTGLTSQTTGATTTLAQLFYCAAPTVGSGHTFTFTGTKYATITVHAFSGAHTSPYVSESGTAIQSGTPIQPGSITPPEDGCAFVAAIAKTSTAAPTGDASFTNLLTAGSSGVNVPGGAGYLIQTTAAAVNPAFGTTNTSAAVMACFKSAAIGHPAMRRFGRSVLGVSGVRIY